MSLKIKNCKDPERGEWASILRRPRLDLESLEETVVEVFREVRERGDEALRNYTRKFDGVDIESFQVPEQQLLKVGEQLSDDLKEAIILAKNNIERFHAAQKTGRVEVETVRGVKCWQEKKPIGKVGVYIPGGSAPLFSTVLMLAIPAKLAGCREIILCSPPDKAGQIHPAVLFAAQLCGVTKVFALGGIQSIAAMTLGTESLPRVYKIFGPGNQYVTAAKQYATKMGIAIDMPAGPSELLVVADDSANSSFVASDLLSQAEHGPDSQVLLVSGSMEMLQQVEQEVYRQLKDLPRREIAEAALQHARFIYLKREQQMLELINEYAPEHLIICTGNPSFFTDGVENAGSVFIGNFTPESAGDYASGTNHTLPTNGYARQYSGVTLDSFQKSISFQSISEEGIRNIGPAIELMAGAEGLEAHRKAVSLRLNYLKEENEK